MFGVIFGLTDAILGLTVLAWGNSIGDLIADTAMAKVKIHLEAIYIPTKNETFFFIKLIIK